MKSLNKALSLFLCIVLFLNMVPIVQGTGVSSEDLAIVSFTVPVISNEYTNDYVTIYEHEDKFFMSLNDIGDFTRSTLTEDDETLTLTHGLREVVISKADGHMVDSGIVDQGNITLLEYNGMYLCEGIPMLQYLGAACSIHEEKELEVLMPIYTIWESIMPDYLDYYFDINELYGGENSVKISLICDILADVLDGVSGHGLFGSYDIHMEDALYEVLNVDMMKYSSVQQSAAEENQKINDFLTSDIYGFILDGSEKTVDGVYEVLDYYAGFYLNTEIWKNSYLEKLYFEAGDLKSASELGSQINKQVYTQSVMQADLKNVKANKSLLSIGMLAFDTAVTSYGLMQYDDDTRNLFARTISDEMIAHTNYHRAGWMSISDKIANTLKSTESIVVNTAATKIAETAVDEVTKYGVQKAISGLTTKGNIYVAAAQIGLYLASLINHSSNEAYSADLNAILLNEAHFDIAMMASQLLVDERDKYHFSNPESLERIKDMFTLYYRFVIAFSENVAISIDKFGGRDDQKWVDWFSSTEEWSVANYAAAYLYRITNCVIVPYVEYAQLTDDIITYDWVSKTDRSTELDSQIWNELCTTYGISSQEGFVSCMGTEIQNYPLTIGGMLSKALIDLNNDGIDELLVLRVSLNENPNQLTHPQIIAEVYQNACDGGSLLASRVISDVGFCDASVIYLFFSEQLGKNCILVDSFGSGSYTGVNYWNATVFSVDENGIEEIAEEEDIPSVGIYAEFETMFSELGVPYAKYCMEYSNFNDDTVYLPLCEIIHTIFGDASAYSSRNHKLWILNTSGFVDDANGSIIDTSNLQSALLNYWWENNIQCPCAYRFLSDGTLLGYYDMEAAYPFCSLNYELNGNAVSIVGDSGNCTELKLVYPTDSIAWDQGVGHNFSELPDSQGFLYEVGFVETDLPENALYFIPTIPVTAP